MIAKPMELLTHSRTAAFKQCRKQHWYSYEKGLRRIVDAKALRMGSAFHTGVESLGLGNDVAKACEAAYVEYGTCPEGYDQHEWNLEAETVARMVSGYEWRWRNSPLTHLTVEQSFQLPLLNPATGAASKTFNLAGKIDAIVQMEDGRKAVKETKLFGDDISVDSDLWPRMRMDQQVSLYLVAARRLGYEVATVLYDVARKPTIKPNNVPILDELGVKIVLDKNGERVKTEKGFWRQTGDTEKGYVVQSRPMTVEEWGEKLTNDIVERPDYYFSRVEIPRLENDLNEFAQEIWDVAKTIMDAKSNDRWYRTVHKNSCSFCSVFELCSRGGELDSVAPTGFEFVTNKNPELGETKNGNCNTTSAAVETNTATTEVGSESYW